MRRMSFLFAAFLQIFYSQIQLHKYYFDFVWKENHTRLVKNESDRYFNNCKNYFTLWME